MGLEAFRLDHTTLGGRGGGGEYEGVSTSGGVSGVEAEDEDGWTTPHWEGEGRVRG